MCLVTDVICINKHIQIRISVTESFVKILKIKGKENRKFFTKQEFFVIVYQALQKK